MNTMIKMESIAVASNPVTCDMIAKKLGLSVDTVYKCMCKHTGRCSRNTVDLVRKTAEEMGYDPKMATAEARARWHAQRRIESTENKASAVQNAIQKNEGCVCSSQEQIANALGISGPTVSKALRGQGPWAEHVIQYAKEVGYINPRSDEAKTKKREKKEADYLLTHNFPSREAETRRMLYLQEQGYSNKDIAKTIGRCVLTVRRRIGAQPADVTKANRAYAMKLRADKNAHRRLTAANHTVNVYNEIVTELEELKNRTTVLETKIEEIKPKLKDALKIATVEPMTISSDNNLVNEEPTVIQ